MSKSALTAYQRTQNTAEDPRDVEYRLLGQVTAALIDAERHPEDSPKMVEAALWNRRVWSAFKIDLLDAGNKLPEELRGKLVSLAMCIERETSDILSFQSDLSWVIGINKAIMDGLKPKGGRSALPPQAFQASAA